MPHTEHARARGIEDGLGVGGLLGWRWHGRRALDGPTASAHNLKREKPSEEGGQMNLAQIPYMYTA